MNRARQGRHAKPRLGGLARLGAFVGRHAGTVALLWIVVAGLCYAGAVGALGTQSLFSRLQQAEPFVPGEAKTGTDILDRSRDAGPSVLVRVAGVTTSDPAAVAAGTAATATVKAIPHVLAIRSPFDAPGGALTPQTAPLFATDKASFLVVVTLDKGLTQATQYEIANRVGAAITDAFRPLPGATITTGGGIHFLHDITAQIQSDLTRGEGVALPLSLVVMVVVFAGFVAASLPIVGALAAIAGGLASLWLFSYVVDLDASVVNITTLLGLALCIDYGLLIVSRFREEVRRIAPHLSKDELDRDHLVQAAQHTCATAGRTVFFSALIVAISLAGLLVFPAPVIRAIGIAGVCIVLVALVVALTLVPALCVLGGRRIVVGRVFGRRGPSRDDSPDEGLFRRLAQFVGRFHLPVVLACTALLVLLAWPTLSMHQVSSSTALLPKENAQRAFLDSARQAFPSIVEPAAIVVAKATPAELDAYGKEVAAKIAGVSSVDPARAVDGGYSALGVRASTAATDPGAAQRVADSLRTQRPAYESYVTGQGGRLSDYLHAVATRAPIAAGIVALATVVLIFLMTGSLALPIKALIFNVLSLGASLGILTWIFQNGHLEGLLGFTSAGGVESLTPVILLAFGFGLAMDYELFLLSRIVELHEQGYSDSDAVELGVQRSGKIITSAALLIIIVLAGFAIAKMLVVKQVGVGLAISVLLDATLVRMLLVPATMNLLGQWNWWAPAPMRRWHDRFALRH